ncbi:hypothetical protein [Bradyrhizobium sp. McL0615]|uniref:hypothetical protein n=1 Tax=Bradyrhizobium sp. McL0615 TaxID=3415673 RepID=UPI003CF79452
MHWYVYPLAAFASVFLAHFILDQVGQPIRSALQLRRTALKSMELFRNVALPKPREQATTSQAIHEHDLAVRNLRGALVTFHNLGTRLLAIGESEPTVRILMSLLGFNVVRAGRALVALSRACAMAGIDSDENRRTIGWALHATRIALGAFRPRSHDELFNIRLEPMYLHEARNRIRLHGRPLAPRRAARLPQLSQVVRGRIASAS